MESKDTDRLLLLILAVLAAPLIAAKFLPPVRGRLLEWHILAAEQVILPFGDGVGLDLPRIIIAAAVLALLAILAATVLRRRAALKGGESQ